MKVLIGCEFSQIVTKAFRDKGHEAYSCDIIDCDINPAWHIKDDVLNHLNDGWDLAIFHPPCTFITNAGVRHLHENVSSKNGVKAKINGAARLHEMTKACIFFNKLANANIPKIAIENPIPHKYAKAYIGEYSQLIQPWQFGEKQSKAICLWLKGLPLLKPTNVVGPPPKNMTQEEKRSWHKVHYTSPGPNRAKERSRFFEGVAKAMVDQWEYRKII